MIISFIGTAFNLVLYRPLFNSLILIYNYLPWQDFGLAVIGLTIIIRFALYPLSVKAFKSQRVMQQLQPKIQDLQRQYKDDKERQTKEMLNLYKEAKVNPFSGLFLVLIQLPILIALYEVFRHGLTAKELNNLYPFISNPGSLNYMFLGLVNMAQSNNIIMAVLAGVFQFFQTKMLMPASNASRGNTGKPAAPKADIATLMQKQMLYVLPIVTGVIMYNLPSALSLYLIATSIFSIVQQYFIIKKSND